MSSRISYTNQTVLLKEKEKKNSFGKLYLSPSNLGENKLTL